MQKRKSGRIHIAAAEVFKEQDTFYDQGESEFKKICFGGFYNGLYRFGFRVGLHGTGVFADNRLRDGNKRVEVCRLYVSFALQYNVYHSAYRDFYLGVFRRDSD
jgi:hypothetical protein